MTSIGRVGFRAVILARREGDKVDADDVRGLRLGEPRGRGGRKSLGDGALAFTRREISNPIAPVGACDNGGPVVK